MKCGAEFPMRTKTERSRPGISLTSALNLPEPVQTADAGIDKTLDAGTLSKAVERAFLQRQVEAGGNVSEVNGVQVELLLRHLQMPI